MAAPPLSPSSWDLFRGLLPRQEVDALDPRAPQAVYTPFVVVWLLVFQRLNKNASLSEAVSELLLRFPPAALPEGKAGRLGSLSPNTAAYSDARSGLDPSVLRWAADRSFASLLPSCPPSFKGKRVFLLDGTSVTLVPEPVLKKAFPPASNQHGQSAWPVLRLLVAHDLDSGLAAGTAHGPMYGTGAESELDLTRRLVPTLPAGSILLADRNFGIFGAAWAAQRAGLGLVARLSGPRWKALLRQAEPDGTGRWRLRWRPSAWDRRSDGSLPADALLQGWLHEADIGEGKKLWLLATEDAGTEELAALYKRRGEVETDLRDLKRTLCLDRMKGRGTAMVEKELLAARLAYNLANQVRRLAAAKAGVEPRKLGFAGTWALLKSFLGALGDGLAGPEAEAGFERLLDLAGRRKLPVREPGRSYPREVLGRGSSFPKRKRAAKKADA
jgi:hypothetical protein